MNEKIALLGIVEILSSLSCGIVILFVTYRIMKFYAKKRLGLEKNNLAYNILTAGVLFSVGHIVSGVIQPILSSYRILSNSKISSGELIGSFIGYGGLYILIGFILALLITFTGIAIYGSMTKVSEIKELKENNLGVAIVLVAIVVTLAIMCGDGVALLIESLIPYPEFPGGIG
ncbi:MAG: hypothetical protein HRT58_10855 [Crocinitomicaceae bacterium]|nr:hypothetical protein [Flavobacteriales bacterium]NQZ36154.1 hypothetical protein [Crocinitomicaceae bacterium]